MNLRGFPRRTLRADRTVYRVHRAKHGPWYFSSDGTGRFDPVGSGQGACYLAERALGAWVEVFCKTMMIAEGAVDERALMQTAMRRDLRLADLTSRRALTFGANASPGANEEYADSQAFAAAALKARYAGVRYLVRHDPAQSLYGIAVFGPPGVADPADPAWPVDEDGPLPADLVEEARREFNYRVLPAP